VLDVVIDRAVSFHILAGTGGGTDGILSVLNPSGGVLESSAYIGSSNSDSHAGIAVPKPDTALIAGLLSLLTSQTEKETIPVRNETDAYVASVNTSLASEYAEFTKTVSSTNVRVGERFTYRLTVKNTTGGI
jgi:hypothetical protein